jgi:CelD/BcsL family acetyltransferase involved in cellulose biosynthesis
VHSAQSVSQHGRFLPVGSCVVDPVEDRRWSELVKRSPDASVFHHPLWLALLRDSYRYSMTAVCVAPAGGEFVAGLPIATVRSRLTGTRLVSVPFSDICGPIAGTGEQQRELLAAVDDERRRRGFGLEIHAEVPLLPGGAPSDRFYHHVVPLDGGVDVVLGKQVKQSKRRGASRARELGVTVSQRVDEAALAAFFRLHVLTRHRLGVPTQPRRFFCRLAPLFDAGLGFVLIAEWEGRPIAASVYLHHGGRLTYKFGASDPTHLDKRANELLQLEGLRIGCDLGCAVVDLGRTELSNDGLRRFKRYLGAEEQELTYTMAPPPQSRNSVRYVSKLQQSVIRRAPPAFGRLLGAAVYRHFG